MTTALRSERRFRREPANAPVRLVRAEALDELAPLEAGWQSLHAVVARPSSQYAWTRAALQAFGEGAMPRVVGVARGAQLLAVAPLVRQRVHGIHRLAAAGARQLHEPVDLVWRDEAALRRLAAAIVRSGSPLVLERVGVDSPSLKALGRACRGRAIVSVRPAPAYPFIGLDESWLEPERHLSAPGREALRECRQCAECGGAVATEIHTPGLHELPELLDTVLEIGDRSRVRLAAASTELGSAVFFRQYAEAACVAGTLRVCLLRIGDRVAATQVAIESGNAFWLLATGSDARFAGCSPERLLLRETIRYAAEAALDSYEFWGCSQAWDWAIGQRRCVSLATYPLNPRGLAALVADGIVAGWRRWKRR